MLARLLSFLFLLSFTFSYASQNRKVLLIGIDGVRSDAFQQANTPHIDGLLASSLYSLDSWHTGITWSGPSWTTILTGVQWNKHLVTNNLFTNDDFTNYPPFPNLAKQIYPNLNCSIVAEWDPLINDITNAGWNHTVKVPDGSNWPSADSAVAELQNPDIDLLFAYFDKVDLAGHNNILAGGFSTSNQMMQGCNRNVRMRRRTLKQWKINTSGIKNIIRVAIISPRIRFINQLMCYRIS
jgi:hypothetical protein